jgi:hypothetical protein
MRSSWTSESEVRAAVFEAQVICSIYLEVEWLMVFRRTNQRIDLELAQ